MFSMFDENVNLSNSFAKGQTMVMTTKPFEKKHSKAKKRGKTLLSRAYTSGSVSESLIAWPGHYDQYSKFASPRFDEIESSSSSLFADRREKDVCANLKRFEQQLSSSRSSSAGSATSDSEFRPKNIAMLSSVQSAKALLAERQRNSKLFDRLQKQAMQPTNSTKAKEDLRESKGVVESKKPVPKKKVAEKSVVLKKSTEANTSEKVPVRDKKRKADTISTEKAERVNTHKNEKGKKLKTEATTKSVQVPTRDNVLQSQRKAPKPASKTTKEVTFALPVASKRKRRVENRVAEKETRGEAEQEKEKSIVQVTKKQEQKKTKPNTAALPFDRPSQVVVTVPANAASEKGKRGAASSSEWEDFQPLVFRRPRVNADKNKKKKLLSKPVKTFSTTTAEQLQASQDGMKDAKQKLIVSKTVREEELSTKEKNEGSASGVRFTGGAYDDDEVDASETRGACERKKVDLPDAAESREFDDLPFCMEDQEVVDEIVFDENVAPCVAVRGSPLHFDSNPASSTRVASSSSTLHATAGLLALRTGENGKARVSTKRPLAALTRLDDSSRAVSTTAHPASCSQHQPSPAAAATSMVEVRNGKVLPRLTTKMSVGTEQLLQQVDTYKQSFLDMQAEVCRLHLQLCHAQQQGEDWYRFSNEQGRADEADKQSLLNIVAELENRELIREKQVAELQQKLWEEEERWSSNASQNVYLGLMHKMNTLQRELERQENEGGSDSIQAEEDGYGEYETGDEGELMYDSYDADEELYSGSDEEGAIIRQTSYARTRSYQFMPATLSRAWLGSD